MHLRHLTGEKIKAVTEAICGKLGIAPEQLPEVQWGEANSRKLWEAVAEAMGFKVQQLRSALHNYKGRHSCTYRPEFEARLRVVAPQWFSAFESADPDGKKAELKAMARRGEPRPSGAKGKTKHPLGVALTNYTLPKSGSYDPVFDKEIRALAPSWFVDTAALKKAELKAMALRGGPRPVEGKHPLGIALSNYTRLKTSAYDPVFDREIRALAPSWFVSRSEKADLKKAELKAMALRGEPRPKQNKHPLGAMLSAYTNPKSNMYDPVFDREIRALRPDWFTRSQQLRKTRTTKKAKTP